MDEEKREEYRLRREQLKQKTSREEQRNRFKQLLDDLKISKREYKIIWAEETADYPAKQWLDNNFDFAWGRIDWNKTKEFIGENWDQNRELTKKLETIIASQMLGDPQIFLVGSDAKSPSLELPLSLALQHTEEILMANWDTWIVCVANKWVIEIYHEGELYFSRK
jgi:hypothetical protein